MWSYKTVTHEEFEKKKNSIEQIILNLGGKCVDFSTSYTNDRTVFEYNNEYFRVDEVLFTEKPFIVIEFGNYDDVMNNTMEDADPFPYDLSYEDSENEVKYSLGIKEVSI